MIKLTKIAALGAVAAIAVAGLTACSTASTPEPTTPAVVEPTVDPTPIGGDIVSPVSLSPAELKGTTQNVVVGQVVNVTVDDPTVWTASVADSTIASVSQGVAETASQAGMNPGFTALKMGTTEATLTNTATGEVITFTIVVA